MMMNLSFSARRKMKKRQRSKIPLSNIPVFFPNVKDSDNDKVVKLRPGRTRNVSCMLCKKYSCDVAK